MRTLIFEDDFSYVGPGPDPAKWRAKTGAGGWGNGEIQRYTAEAARLDDQGLTITAALGPLDEWTSARLDTRGLFSFVYGRVEAAIKIPSAQGIWPAFWLCGATPAPWPQDGEIDIMESVSQRTGDARVVNNTVHSPKPDGTGHVQLNRKVAVPINLAAGHNVYTVDWSASRIAFDLNGQRTAMITSSNVVAAGGRWAGTFDQPMGLLLNVAVGGSWAGAPDETTPAVNAMSVEWVRVYQ